MDVARIKNHLEIKLEKAKMELNSVSQLEAKILGKISKLEDVSVKEVKVEVKLIHLFL